MAIYHALVATDTATLAEAAVAPPVTAPITARIIVAATSVPPATLSRSSSESSVRFDGAGGRVKCKVFASSSCMRIRSCVGNFCPRCCSSIPLGSLNTAFLKAGSFQHLSMSAVSRSRRVNACASIVFSSLSTKGGVHSRLPASLDLGDCCIGGNCGRKDCCRCADSDRQGYDIRPPSNSLQVVVRQFSQIRRRRRYGEVQGVRVLFVDEDFHRRR